MPTPPPSSRPHPDLTYPYLPDAEEDLPLPSSSSSVFPRGLRSTTDRTDLRPTLDGREYEYQYQWPEAGPSKLPPSSSPGGEGGETEAEVPATVGPFGAKAVAAMTGAMATSLLMTPFDVLKTRLQTVQPHPRSAPPPPPPLSSAASLSPSSMPVGAGTDCCQTTMLTSSRIPAPGSSSSSASASNPLTCLNSAPVVEASSSTARNQAKSTSNVSFSSVRPAAAPAAPPSGCLYPSKWAGIWGEAISFEQALSRGLVGSAQASAGGAGGGALLVLPASATPSQTFAQAGAAAERSVASGFWSEIAAVRRETGIRGLWKGVGTAITMGIPSSAIYMIGYEHLLVRISPFFTGSTNPALNASSLSPDSAIAAAAASASTTSAAAATIPHRSNTLTASLTPAPLLAGSLARTLSATVISPIEMFRTRLQALPSVDRGSPTYASTARDMSALVRNQGVTILWRGLGPTLWRDVPFSGIYWASFELLKSLLTSSSSPLPPLTPISTSFISGFLSGTLSALLTQPFDVLKTRRQVFNPSPTCITPNASTIPLALHVIETEGVKALFAGMSARVGKVAPACGLMIACYEGVGRWLGGQQGGKRAL